MVTVICTGGEAPPPTRCLPWIDQCQEIIAADGGFVWLRDLGKRADIWVGDGDSLDGADVTSDAGCGQRVLLQRQKDETDTEAAVTCALSRGAKEIWLLGGGGRRMDHWLSNLKTVASTSEVRRWMTAYEEIYPLGTGETLVLNSGTISVFPIGGGPWKIRSQGLRWPLDSVDFATMASQSNEAEGPNASVSVDSGRFMVLVPFPELGGE